MKQRCKYYAQALERLKQNIHSFFPDRKLRVWINEDGEYGGQLTVSGDGVPLEAYKFIEHALTDRRHPYVDFGWTSDEAGKNVLHRFGEPRKEWFGYYRNADQQIEIEQSVDAAFARQRNARNDLLSRLKTITPCMIKLQKCSEKRMVTVGVFAKQAKVREMTKKQREEWAREVHQIVGNYFYGDGGNDFNLETGVGEINERVSFVSTLTLCGRGPFSNSLLAAMERERKAFAVIGRHS